MLVVAGLCSDAAASKVQRQVQVHRTPSGELVEPWDGRTVQDLHREYGNIFRYGNRNAASHMWSSFLINRARFMPENRFQHLSGGYCAVSGSPVSPSDSTRYRLSLERADGTGKQTGFMYYCCWPCVCDTQDFIKVDTKTVTTAEGPREYSFAVIGNPCERPQELSRPFVQPFDHRSTTIEQEAREVRCSKNGELEGATMSDHNYVIISMFFDASKPTLRFQDESDFEFMCDDRKNHGYNSGMGEIFRRVAAISPIALRPAFAPIAGLTVKQLHVEAARWGLDTRGVADKTELLTLLERGRAAELQKLGTQQIRNEARRLGLDLRGIADKSELVRLLEEALLGAAAASAEAPAVEAGSPEAADEGTENASCAPGAVAAGETFDQRSLM